MFPSGFPPVNLAELRILPVYPFNMEYMMKTINKLWTLVLFMIVLDQCQDRRDCRIMANPQSFGQDPCPGTSKYLEVAYKCRPNEFRSRTTCEGETLRLKCQKSKKLAIYSAMFGQSQQGNADCPANPIYETDCQAECAFGRVMSECHGKKRCRVESSESVFGNPCRLGTPKYLSVIYTCVPKRILKEIKDEQEFPNSFCGDLLPDPGDVDGGGGEEFPGYGDNGGPDEYPWEPDYDGGASNGGRRNISGQPSYLPSPSTYTYGIATAQPTLRPGVPGQDTGNNNNDGGDHRNNRTMVQCKAGDRDCVSADPSTGAVGDKTVGLITDWIWTWNYISENKEKLILYLCLGLCVGVILLLLVIIIRLMMTRRRKESSRQKLDISEPMETSAPPENMTLLNDSDRNDGIEMLSFNQSNSLRRPPPGGTLTRSNPYSRPDPGNHSINNYYG